MLIEKQRSEQEVASLRLFMDEERKEMAEMRRQQQEVLNVDGGEPLSLMYSQLLQNYENVKDEYSLLRKRYDDLAASHSAAVSKLEHSQVRNTFQPFLKWNFACIISHFRWFSNTWNE